MRTLRTLSNTFSFVTIEQERHISLTLTIQLTQSHQVFLPIATRPIAFVPLNYAGIMRTTTELANAQSTRDQRMMFVHAQKASPGISNEAVRCDLASGGQRQCYTCAYYQKSYCYRWAVCLCKQCYKRQ